MAGCAEPHQTCRAEGRRRRRRDARSLPRRLSAFTLPADGPRALTRDQYALLDELTEILIPADEHSGGARAAGVAAYIDAMLAEEFDASVKASFVSGLALVDGLAQQRHGRAFLALSPAEREAIVATMAEGEKRIRRPTRRDSSWR